MSLDSKKFAVDAAAVRDHAYQTIVGSRARITPTTLEKKLIEDFGLYRKRIKSIIRDLVASGDLTYTYQYGCTFLERSFAKPVRVSVHFVLQPPGLQATPGADDVVVRINPGAAFGAGNHPTTRLAIEGLEFSLIDGSALDIVDRGPVLDIGTGSGVLLISAVLGGCKTGLGIDIDGCARAEAAENVKINGLEDRVVISGYPLDDISERYSIILANLRFPTLRRLRFQIKERAEPGCFLVLSGIRDHEYNELINCYEDLQFQKRWAANELGWSGVVLQRRD